MKLTDERRKAMYANKFNKARKQGFDSAQFVTKEFGDEYTPSELLAKSIEVRKNNLDSAHITKEEDKLYKKYLYSQNKRINVGMNEPEPYYLKNGRVNPKYPKLGSSQNQYRHHWENEKNAIISLADLQGNKLREGFAPS